MAIPTSGQIAASALITELNRTISSGAFSIDTAENGGYRTINTNSLARPSAANPAAFSEWYGYNHDAGGGGGGIRLTRIELGYSGRSEGSNIGEIEACSQFSSDLVPCWYRATDGAWFTVPLLGNSGGTTFAQAGWYSDQPYAGGFTVRYWRGSSWASTAALCAI